MLLLFQHIPAVLVLREHLESFRMTFQGGFNPVQKMRLSNFESPQTGSEKCHEGDIPPPACEIILGFRALNKSSQELNEWCERYTVSMPIVTVKYGYCFRLLPLLKGHVSRRNDPVCLPEVEQLIYEVKSDNSGDSWMYPYQRTPMGNPYISPI